MNLIFDNNCEIENDINLVIEKLLNNHEITIYTSGTTGEAKPIAKSVEIIQSNNKNTDKWLLSFSPLKWSGISVLKHILKINSNLYIPKNLTYNSIIECGFNNLVTHISITPSLFKTIILNDIDNKFKQIPFKQITFGGEVATQSVLDLANKLFPQANITHVYAQTELGDICSVSDKLEGVNGYKFKKDGYEFNDENELIINSINTQDIWEYNSDNDRYYFIGRKSEIINVGGIKVSPIKVEETAISCGCFFTKVYAKKNLILGNIICLDYVGDITEEQLKINLKVKLSKYEMPMKINKVDYIKLSESNKLIRK